MARKSERNVRGIPVFVPRLVEPELVARLPEALREVYENQDPALNEIAQAIEHGRAAGFDVDDETFISMAIEAGRRRYESDREMRLLLECVTRNSEYAKLARPAKESRVYFMRIGNRVKIGFSHDVRKRMESFRPEEILATIPGGRDLEAQLHERFDRFRITGEWFALEGELAAYISGLQGGEEVA